MNTIAERQDTSRTSIIFYFKKKGISIKKALIRKTKTKLTCKSSFGSPEYIEKGKLHIKRGNKGFSEKTRCPGARPFFFPHSYTLLKLPKRSSHHIRYQVHAAISTSSEPVPCPDHRGNSRTVTAAVSRVVLKVFLKSMPLLIAHSRHR